MYLAHDKENPGPPKGRWDWNAGPARLFQQAIARARTIAVILAITMSVSFEAKAQSGQTAAQLPYPVVQGKVYKFEKVADGVYYATGGMGSNIPIIVNDHDVMVVDDGSTPTTARALLEDLKLITANPIRYVVNTHFHYDHTDGNSVFPPEVEIIAQEYVRTKILTSNVLESEPYKTSQTIRMSALIESLKKHIEDEKDSGQKAELEKQLAAAQTLWDELKEIKPTPPNVTYTTKMVLYAGQREIQLLFLGRGHTGGDTVVFLPKERIVCTGDLMESRPAYLGDAFFDEWVATLDALKKLDFTLVLPGHGKPFSDKGLITAFQGYLTDVMNQVANLRRQGVSPEIAAQRVDLRSHQKDFPEITGPGAELRGIRRLYEWMDERGIR
jgi:glyoxylase-like metal-dependent hydrolase (beta-lactamase superfamily II)